MKRKRKGKRNGRSRRTRQAGRLRRMLKGRSGQQTSQEFDIRETFYWKGYEWGVALALEIDIKIVVESTSGSDLPFLTTEDQLGKLFIDLSRKQGLLELIKDKSDPDFVEAKIGFIDGFRKTFDKRLKEYIKKLS